jgi:hypothetical protein
MSEPLCNEAKTSEVDCGDAFSKRLEALLNARGYPRTNYGRNKLLSGRIGVTDGYVHKMFKGTLPSPKILSKLAIELNSTTDYLLGLTDEMNRPAETSRMSGGVLINRIWHPVDENAPHFEVPRPGLQPGFSPLRVFWACRLHSNQDKTDEIVIYDKSDLDDFHGKTFLMKLDGVLQIRTVEIVETFSARLWFYEGDVEHCATLQITLDGFMPVGCDILGRVITRIAMGEHRSSLLGRSM